MLAERIAQEDVRTLPDWRVAEVLNAPDKSMGTKIVDIATSDVMGILLTMGDWPNVVLAAQGVMPSGDKAPLAVQRVAVLVRDTLLHMTQIQTSKPDRYEATMAALAGMQAAGLITRETQEALAALPLYGQSWSEANQVDVTAQSVGIARGGRK